MTRKQKLSTTAAVVVIGTATMVLLKPSPETPPMPPGFVASKADAPIAVALPAFQTFNMAWNFWTNGISSPLAGNIVLRHSTNLVTWDTWSYPKTATNATITVIGAPAHFFNIGYNLVPWRTGN